MPSILKRDDSSFSGGSIAGTVVGLVCVALVFFLGAFYVFKHRAKKRRTERAAKIHSHPAAINARLNAYSRQQQSRIRSSNARQMSESERGRLYGRPPVSDYSPSPGPPPSYNAVLRSPDPVVTRQK